MAGVGGGNGVVLGLERLVDGERIHDEYLPRRCRQAARALVEVLEIGGFQAEAGPDRGRDALSRTWNRDFGDIPTVRFTTECPGPGPAANPRRWAAYIMFKVTMTTGGAATCWWWLQRPRWASGPRCRGPGSRGVHFGADLARIGLRVDRFRTMGGLVVAARFRIGRWGGTAR